MTGAVREPTLVFVYNVDGSPVAMLKDAWAGITTGRTDCRLCDLTFGRILKDRSWRRFVGELPIEVDFKLRSTFLRAHPDLAHHRFPAVFVDGPVGMILALPAAEIEQAHDLDALRLLVDGVVTSLDAGRGATPADRTGGGRPPTVEDR